MNAHIDLNDRQTAFVDQYLSNGNNATQAYKDAGYKYKSENVAGVSAYKLLKTPKIVEEISRRKAGDLARQAQRAERIHVDETWLINQYLDTITGAKGDGQWSTVKGCIDSIGKLTGHMVDRRELKVGGQVDHQMSEMDTEELLEALETVRQPALEGDYRTLDPES